MLGTKSKGGGGGCKSDSTIVAWCSHIGFRPEMARLRAKSFVASRLTWFNGNFGDLSIFSNIITINGNSRDLVFNL